MSKKTDAMIKSYVRGLITAVAPLIAMQETNPKAYAFAVIAGVISPAIRAIDKNDPAFGMIADALKDSTKKK